MLLESLSKLILNSPPVVKMIPTNTIEPKNKDPAHKACHLLNLPNEMLYIILSSLTWSDVGRLCLTGSSVFFCILLYSSVFLQPVANWLLSLSAVN